MSSVNYISDEFFHGYGCRCYTDVHTGALVADCSDLGLIEIPQNLPNYTDWLIVSGNNISSLDQETLKTPILPYITKLDISRNRLENISHEFIEVFTNPYFKLSFLDISSNNLVRLPRNIMNISSLRNLRLTGNSFQCDCENLWMKNWLNNSNIIENSTNIRCTMSKTPGEEILMIHMREKDMDCPSDNPILNPLEIFGIISSIFVLVLVLVIIWSNRKAIKFWIFVRFSYKFKDKDEPVENINDFDYDAFVNYR